MEGVLRRGRIHRFVGSKGRRLTPRKFLVALVSTNRKGDFLVFTLALVVVVIFIGIFAFVILVFALVIFIFVVFLRGFTIILLLIGSIRISIGFIPSIGVFDPNVNRSDHQIFIFVNIFSISEVLTVSIGIDAFVGRSTFVIVIVTVTISRVITNDLEQRLDH